MKSWLPFLVMVSIVYGCHTGPCQCDEECDKVERSNSKFFKGIVILNADSDYPLGFIQFIDVNPSDSIFKRRELSILYKHSEDQYLEVGDTVFFQIGYSCDIQYALNIVSTSDNPKQNSKINGVGFNIASQGDEQRISKIIQLDSKEPNISTTSSHQSNTANGNWRKCNSVRKPVLDGYVKGVVELVASSNRPQGLIRLVDIYPEDYTFDDPMRGVIYWYWNAKNLKHKEEVYLKVYEHCGLQYALNIEYSVDSIHIMNIGERHQLLRRTFLNLHNAADHPEGPSHKLGHIQPWLISGSLEYYKQIPGNTDYWQIKFTEFPDDSFAILTADTIDITWSGGQVYYQTTGPDVSISGVQYEPVQIFQEHDHRWGDH